MTRTFQLLLPCGHAGRLDGSFSRHKSAPPRYIGYGMSTSTRARDRRNETMPEVPRASRRSADANGAAAARGMSRPTATVLILVGIGLALFVLRIFGIGWLQYRWVLALSICLVALACTCTLL